MKLALVTETFPPEINGVAMTLSQLAGGLARRGVEVTVHRPRQSGDPRVREFKTPVFDPQASEARSASAHALFTETLHPGVPIPGYPFLRLGLPARGALLRAWRAVRPDVVHVATEGPLGWSALSAADALGIPLASSFHTNFHHYSKHYGFAFLTRPALAYLRWFHNRTRITLSPTEELNRELERDGFRGMRLLSRGVDTELFSPARRDEALRRAWGAGADDPVFLHVSRLAAEKNYALLFRAWDRIRSAHPASADVFLYPSLTETFGNVVTEAMASGLAIGAFDYAAAGRYLRHGENGLLARFGDEDAFLALASRLAESDPRQRRRLGLVARATAENIPWSRVIDGFARDLAEVAKAGPTQGRGGSVARPKHVAGPEIKTE